MIPMNNCSNGKPGLSTLLAAISGIVMVAAAVSVAVYFVLKFVEKKEKCDYIECDCYGDDYDGYGDDDEIAEEADEAKVTE